MNTFPPDYSKVYPQNVLDIRLVVMSTRIVSILPGQKSGLVFVANEGVSLPQVVDSLLPFGFTLQRHIPERDAFLLAPSGEQICIFPNLTTQHKRK